MAITSFDIACNKPPKSLFSTNSYKTGNAPKSCHFKINFISDSSASCTTNKSTKSKKRNSNSPYLKNDKVQLLSRVTEKRLVHKKTTDFVSSFPLAANIYKANSDELNSFRRVNKKVKKSVLTLPNDPAPLPQVCTVSDINDSEYQDRKDDKRKCKVKKRLFPNNKKIRVRNKDFEFYDRDARYCSQLNIDLNCSSTDMIKYNGDRQKVSKINKSNKFKGVEDNFQAHDVWAVLRNINRFQFYPSPPMSEESILPKKKKGPKRRNNCNDTRVIETCHTEEFAYISSYELDGQSNQTFSQSSSIDRITVIDKQDEFSQICNKFEKRILNTSDLFNDTQDVKHPNQIKNKNTKINPKNNVKSRGNTGLKENNNRALVLNKNNLRLKSLKKKFVSSDNCPQKIEICDIISRTSSVSITIANDDKENLICSTHSGSSKAGLEANSQNVSKDKNTLLKISSEESDAQIIGISKVVLSKGCEKSGPKEYSVQKDLLKRKPRLLTTMLSTAIMPRLTQTEIKKRLARISFPIIVLGKDQISSQVEVLDYDPPQFNGLDNHIWPFMVEWSNNKKLNNRKTVAEVEGNVTRLLGSRKCSPNISEYNAIKPGKHNEGIAARKQLNSPDRKYFHTEYGHNNTKSDLIADKGHTPFTAISSKLQQYKKQKPILQLKERMLNLLYKKASNKSIDNENKHIQCRKLDSPSYINEVHIGIDVQDEYDNVISEELPKRRYTSPVKSSPGYSSSVKSSPANKRSLNNSKLRWAKAKWASDFIENVIRKIKTGVYYTQDNKELNHKHKSNMEKILIQTTPIFDRNLDLSVKDFNVHNEDPLKIISEFDNTLSAVEIKTFNRNQIAIKHCVTNVMVQFDVSTPTETTQFTMDRKISSSLIPLEVTESHTKIFKSKTTIVNAVLPAELCSILPKIMRNIIDAKGKPVQALMPPPVFDKVDCHLTTISELCRVESPQHSKGFVLSSCISHEIKKAIDGMFPKTIIQVTKSANANTYRKLNFNYKLISGLLPRMLLNDLLPYRMTRLIITIPIQNVRQFCSHSTQMHNLLETQASTVLVPYIASKHSLIPTYSRYNIMGMIENIMKYQSFQIFFNTFFRVNELRLQYDGENVTVNMSAINNRGLSEEMTLIVNKSQVSSLFTPEFKNGNKGQTVTSNNHLNGLKCIEKNRSKDQLIVTTNKGRRKGFFKLYRKCKSTTNIPSADKCFNTPISKIANLDDFFQVLGSQRCITAIFDGCIGRKIMSSVIEMRNWISEINPSQAMLVLLLTNKKDTPNLVRFRPVLLQGIAVNRITRATELDLEIEVIERENFHKLSQYEGISYLPASVENHDNLLEELYWIAKTTASDYQRPFDDESERHLKSLLEKRKKLNPSYLRVMARYVGLGLLKSPVKQ